MSVVLRDNIAKSLFRFGKKVEKEIRDGNKLNILELNNLLRPTLETIESKAVSFVTKEVEENIAKNHDNARKRKRENICERRRSTLSEKVLLETPMKKVRIDRSLASKIQELDGAVSYDPIKDLDCLSDSDVLKYDTDDQSWDEYLPEVHIDFDGEYNLCAGNLDELIEYLDDNAETVEGMLDILKSVKENDILSYEHFLPGMIKLCNLLIRKNSDWESAAGWATWEQILGCGSEGQEASRSSSEASTETLSVDDSENIDDNED